MKGLKTSHDFPPKQAEAPAASALFLTTQWTVILAAGGSGPFRDSAMEQFAKTYWYPIYSFIRRRGEDEESAKDLTQEFFAHLLDKNWLAGVERRQTRFSTLMLSILTNFLVSEHRHASRLKRGGGEQVLSLDLAAAENWFGCEPKTDENPEDLFERRFALAVLEGALQRLREETTSAGRGVQFELLAPYLSADPKPGDYATVGETLGISKNAVAAAVLRLRKEYRSAVRSEVSAGLVDPAQVDEEMRHLAAAVSGSSMGNSW
jgi:RNA polymerase sigma-70 factor (ECF subfamily)